MREPSYLSRLVAICDESAYFSLQEKAFGRPHRGLLRAVAPFTKDLRMSGGRPNRLEVSK